MTERTKRQRVLVAGMFLLAILAVVVWSLETLPAFVARDMTLASAFAYFAIMFGTFNVFDWLVIDCGLVLWQPRFLVLPGTEGMAGYRNYWFHFRGFLIGIPIVLVGSALFAGIVSIILRVRYRAGRVRRSPRTHDDETSVCHGIAEYAASCTHY